MHPTIATIQKGNLKKVPEVKTGYTVEVSQKVTEGAKERIQKFKGLVIKIGHGAGVEKTFIVRKMVEGIGVEKTFPFHSPNITKIHVVKKAKVRRQKLYYMRQRFGKSARLSEKHVTDEERATEEAKMEALYAEAVKAEEKQVSEAGGAVESVKMQDITSPEEAKQAPADQSVAEASAQEEASESSQVPAPEASEKETEQEVAEKAEPTSAKASAGKEAEKLEASAEEEKKEKAESPEVTKVPAEKEGEENKS